MIKLKEILNFCKIRNLHNLQNGYIYKKLYILIIESNFFIATFSLNLDKKSFNEKYCSPTIRIMNIKCLKLSLFKVLNIIEILSPVSDSFLHLSDWR